MTSAEIELELFRKLESVCRAWHELQKLPQVSGEEEEEFTQECHATSRIIKALENIDNFRLNKLSMIDLKEEVFG